MGGAPRSLYFLIKHLDKKIYSPQLYILFKGAGFDFLKTLNITIKPTRISKAFHGSHVSDNSFASFLKQIVYFIPTLFEAIIILKTEKPKILHLNSTCLFAFAIASKIASKRTKVVIHVREPIVEGYLGFPLRFFSRNFADHLIAICRNDLNSLKINKKNKVNRSVVYNYVDFSEYNTNIEGTLRSELNIDDKAFICIFLARFDYKNGIFKLKEWAEKITNSNKEIHFVFAGGEYEDEIKNQNIHFIGFRKDVSNLIASCNVNICPFLTPHFARSIIESAAMGTPSIGNNIGGVNELIQHNKTGLLYNNYEEFVFALEKLKDDSNYFTELSLNSKKYAEENFELKKNSQKILDIYEKLFDRK